MSELASIVTHPGGAHKDDFLACAVLLARHSVPIERREPTEQDLLDPTVAVVDVGDRHEPEKHNFDHHQFARDAVPTCALSLVLQSMGRYEDARDFCDWLEMAEWLDCRGAFGAARQFGLDPEVFNQLLSPLDVTLLRRFARSEKLEQGDTLWEGNYKGQVYFMLPLYMLFGKCSDDENKADTGGRGGALSLHLADLRG